MLSIEKVFEEEGVLGDVTISEWDLGFIPLEEDLLSIELPEAGYKDMYLVSSFLNRFLSKKKLTVVVRPANYNKLLCNCIECFTKAIRHISAYHR